MHFRKLVVLFAAVGVLWSVEAQSQNEITNPDFPTDVAPWTIGSQEFVLFNWDSDDVYLSAISGSASVESQTASAYQCIPILGGTDYDVEGWIAPIGIDRPATIVHSIEVEWFGGAGCAFGTSLGRDVVTPTQVPNTWNFGSDVFTAPVLADSARVHLQNRAGPPLFGVARAIFDEVYVPEPAFGSLLGMGCIALAGAGRRRRSRPSRFVIRPPRGAIR